MKKFSTALVVVVALASFIPTAAATANPAPRAFTASFRTFLHSSDQLLVKVYATDHRSGITYTCFNPTESNSSSSSQLKTTWQSNGLCAADRGARLPVTATDVFNLSTFADTLYVTMPGFLPVRAHAYRYKCFPVESTYTSSPQWFGNTYAALHPCPVG